MEIRELTSAFVLTTLLLGIPTAANAQTRNPIFGTWRVTSFKLQVIGERGGAADAFTDFGYSRGFPRIYRIRGLAWPLGGLLAQNEVVVAAESRAGREL
jgi:hypothetical protein